MRLFDRIVGFELKELGDEVYELKVTRVTSLFLFGFVRASKSRFGSFDRCQVFMGEELKK